MNVDANKILSTYLFKKDAIVLFWDNADGWEILCTGDGFIKPDSWDDGIFELSNLVSKDYKFTYQCFLNAVRSKMSDTLSIISNNKQTMSIVVAFDRNDDSAYYKIICYSGEEDFRGKYKNLLVRIEPLDAEGSYRYRLSQTITNDKNPQSFNDEVARIFKRYPDRKYALIQFDTVNFKMLNKQYGESFGDELLSFFIDNLNHICDDDQLYVRLTADVFMILTPYDDVDDILMLIDKIKYVLSGYKGVDYRFVFGISYVRDLKEPLRTYGDAAAIARQSVKGNALKYYAFYDDHMIDGVSSDKWIEDRMEKALDNREFVMYLQPKYDIANEKIVGAEALVRWVHPDKGIIPPNDFIPLFERNGFIVKLDQFMWEEACKTLDSWIKTNKPMIPISVNVSRKHMTANDIYIHYLNDLILKYGIDKKYLELEITETLDDSYMNNTIQHLKKNGYTLLMDDFGSGYSSLNTLKDTQFDVIKIDRGFLCDFIDSERGKSIIKHIISMSKEIGLDIVAEGVETLEQTKFLIDCGCNVAQGFYYAKPMTVADFNKRYFDN